MARAADCAAVGAMAEVTADVVATVLDAAVVEDVAVDVAVAAWAGTEVAMSPTLRAAVTSTEAGKTRRRVAGSTKQAPLDADRVS
jgi:hypothetical protein